MVEIFRQDQLQQQNLLMMFQYLLVEICLLYTSDAADERSSVDLGGRRIIKKKKSVGSERRASLLTRKLSHWT